MKIIAIIQARMGSTRHPGKVMMPMAGKPMLWFVIDRARHSKLVNEVVVATSVNPENKIILDKCKEWNVKTFVGSEDDVLDRYYRAAKAFKADVIVRLTSDNPLTCPKTMDITIKKHIDDKNDYTQNDFISGNRVEVLNFEVLERLWKEVDDREDREHVTNYILKNPHKFRIGLAEDLYKAKTPEDARLTVDTSHDFELVSYIHEKLYKEGSIIDLNDVIALLKKNPELMDKNKHIQQHNKHIITPKKEHLQGKKQNAKDKNKD